jgi:Sec-independent protein translocase protein TatA
VGELSVWHVLIVSSVVIVLFAPRRLPIMARWCGRRARAASVEASKLVNRRPEAAAESRGSL